MKVLDMHIDLNNLNNYFIGDSSRCILLTNLQLDIPLESNKYI